MKLHIITEEEKTGQVRARLRADQRNKMYTIGVVRYKNAQYIPSYPVWSVPFPREDSLNSILAVVGDYIREQHLRPVLEINGGTKRRFEIRDGQDIDVQEDV